MILGEIRKINPSLQANSFKVHAAVIRSDNLDQTETILKVHMLQAPEYETGKCTHSL
jgi:hypothetical protein